MQFMDFSFEKMEYVEEEKQGNCILDLPELALDCILSRLSPKSLCNMAGVCKYSRERCKNDHLWAPHLEAKWAKVGMKKDMAATTSHNGNSKGSLGSLKPVKLKMDSLMAFYASLESGDFWFPAQVLNPQHGRVGFTLSFYDAELSYDCTTDSFQARYPLHGSQTIVREKGIQWERLRAPPMVTYAHDLYISDCLNDLCPGDDVEIQWRRNKEFPYGWLYGVVAHLVSCSRDSQLCRCHLDDTIFLKFIQDTPGSLWRYAAISRKDHSEEGNDSEGFYGGIRKLKTEEEILAWRQIQLRQLEHRHAEEQSEQLEMTAWMHQIRSLTRRCAELLRENIDLRIQLALLEGQTQSQRQQ